MKATIIQKLFLFSLFIIVSLMLSGCGMWRDFTTYFNTYYNAKTLFDQTEEEILKNKTDIFAFREDQTANRNTAQNFNPNLQQQQQQQRQLGMQGQGAGNQAFAGQPGVMSGSVAENLKKVIEKCSKILQYDQESSFFVNALFMTGKALYYQQEYARAQRKFIELSGVGEHKFSDVNKIWLAKTHLQLREFESGIKLLDEVKTKALEIEDDELFNDAVITKISFYLFRMEYSNAITEANNYLEHTDDDEMRALVYFQLGNIYQKINENDLALESYKKVLEYSPTFETEYRSRLEHAKLLKQLDRVDDSKKEFVRLSNEGKFVNYLDEILIELGQIYIETEEYETAFKLFVEVDSVYKAKPTGGIAASKIGEIYEKYYRDYDSTLKYYNKAVSSLIPAEQKAEVIKRVRNFEKFTTVHTKINASFLQLEYNINPDRFIRDSIDYAFAYREYQAEQEKIAEQQKNQAQQFQQNPQQQPLPQLDPNDKNAVFTPAQLIALGKLKQPAKLNYSVDTLKYFIAQDYYELGNLFFSELEVLDSAYYYFNKTINDYADKPAMVQALFALGTYYETLNDSVRADSLFKIIYDKYEKHPLWTASGEKLGLVKKEEKKIVSQTTDPAEGAYNKAEEIYYDGKFLEAIDEFRKLIVDYPTSPFVPKALMHIGVIFENDLKQYDSAAVAYGKIVDGFKTTNYAKAVTDKYASYQAEIDKKKKEDEAKRKAEEQKIIDEKKIAEVNDSTKVKTVLNDELAFPDSVSIQQRILQARKKEAYFDSLKTRKDTSLNNNQVPDEIAFPDSIGDRSKNKQVPKKEIFVDSLKTKKDSLLAPPKFIKDP
jgi:tetratricopeptide (TPR) repeat protein